jgi:hypothetical protein
MTRIMLLVAAGVGLAAQTMPWPDQIRNPDQVRVCKYQSDTRPGTLVSGCQIRDARRVCDGSVFIGPPDTPFRTVCLAGWILSPSGVERATEVYTVPGLAQLLTDPAWLAWWNAQP